MLSLFKLAFSRRNKKEQPEKLPTQDISFSIFRNFHARKMNISDEASRAAADEIEAEMRSLEEALQYVDADKRYDLISGALRRIDERLR